MNRGLYKNSCYKRDFWPKTGLKRAKGLCVDGLPVTNLMILEPASTYNTTESGSERQMSNDETVDITRNTKIKLTLSVD